MSTLLPSIAYCHTVPLTPFSSASESVMQSFAAFSTVCTPATDNDRLTIDTSHDCFIPNSTISTFTPMKLFRWLAKVYGRRSTPRGRGGTQTATSKPPPDITMLSMGSAMLRTRLGSCDLAIGPVAMCPPCKVSWWALCPRAPNSSWRWIISFFARSRSIPRPPNSPPPRGGASISACPPMVNASHAPGPAPPICCCCCCCCCACSYCPAMICCIVTTICCGTPCRWLIAALYPPRAVTPF